MKPSFGDMETGDVSNSKRFLTEGMAHPHAKMPSSRWKMAGCHGNMARFILRENV